MDKIYTALQLQELYREASTHTGLAPSDLCERGAIGFVNAFNQLYRSNALVHIFAGPRDNGAYALAIARLLHEAGRSIRIYLFFHQGKLSDLCEDQRLRLVAQGASVQEVTTQFDPPSFAPGQLIIDGLFGSECVHPLEGGFAALTDLLNGSGLDIVSVDLPSGLFADDNSGNDLRHIVRARHTITFVAPRLAMLLEENKSYIGHWQVIPLAIKESVHQQIHTRYHLQSEQMLSQALRQRATFASDGDYGRALIVGGGAGRYGQLALAARASLYAGCGEIEVLTDEAGASIVQTITPEATTIASDHTTVPNLRGYDAIGIGMANVAEVLTLPLLRGILSVSSSPMVLDRGAIELLATEPELLGRIPRESILLIGHRHRNQLLGRRYSDLDYIEQACSLASKHGLTLVLKGTYTAVCRSSGHVFFNSTGNAGMNTVATSDVLAGLLVGLLARGYEPLTATLLGCYIHGMAGDLCAGRLSMESLTASALLAEVPTVFRHLYAD